MLISADNSALLVIDVQAKLLSGVYENEKLVDNCHWLIEVAQLMGVPVLGSEQYPKGVGPTTERLSQLLAADDFVAKTEFSCVDSDACYSRIQSMDRKSIVICGMEAHVCVLQTALRLKEEGFQVYVVADAVSARNPVDTEYALARLRDEGVRIVTREMVGFEWVRRSDAPQFKTFSLNFLR
ncbi:Nicotinamidase-related amidase [Oceanospirillum multiglobuliferum]|uniref:Hydrolase n=1 Tax=Oceanospirillum multiglobuliferum TaxID=64969 RepID=A0A1T4KF65_9GAMM|nr:hydrolase [Oceanospirillum multiglobuliferum]OPX56008.1 hydrolase [Oceanospirillum multiglobuliferum]SJZ40983.1 Nicotinamidase-related amidase [Oceanospirillum multiglobuliferum]